MTPATQREVLLTHLVWPNEPSATEEAISWSSTRRNWAEHFPGTATLLDDFIALERSLPSEMAAFVARYGVPGFIDGDDAGSVRVADVRLYARGISAGRRVGAALTSRRPGAQADWLEMQHVVFRDWPAGEDFTDWALGRERYAHWLSMLFATTSVTIHADWVGARGLALQPSAGSLLGLIAILLAREVGAEHQYECDSCGARVYRRRPPKAGEGVYCDRVECKREQQRRNQAKWRAKKASEAGGRN